ncbi:SpoIIE family protein phosphatase [Sinanaerobacter chloroacetimidivorans]|jgi:stage II sporulation protein E|uniref:SpoIIE family protein phosphatase n=1 Tax=Sinanaerobacter chloroacetimidivorans TaxID=2818044 RepID=A0A8J7W2D2_9FIRM|nr:SpoIIE family protein phosphatase [Sinanaerobacter chloroacetimidivorans]MBR0599121.1 SpoIIE family protein phosphatase [Sinanaerobacter chloroacetimidivorans]
MELLLENVRNTFFSKRAKTSRTVSKVAAYDYARVILIVASSFLLGRVSLFYAIFPCGIALITVLMSKGRANVYTLPIILGGLLTNYGTGYDLWGDAIAVLVCGIGFFLLNKIKISIVMRAFIAAGVMVLAKSIYYFLSPLVFVYDVFMMFVEAILILAFVYIFYIFYGLIDKEVKNKSSIAESVIATTVVITMLLGGIGIESIWVFSPLYLGALFLTLFIGYKIGVMEGGSAGVASGIVVMIVSSGSPAIIGIFACAGMVAGFFKGLNRVVTAVCFAAVCLAFGLIKGYPELYISIYDPLLAAGVFALLPQSLMNKTELVFARIRQDHIYYELLAKDRMKIMLGGYLETFEKLAVLYSDTKNRSNIISMQFRGMAKVIRTMMEELTVSTATIMQPKEKYQIKVGVSSYAKEDNVSGDSYVCADLKDGEFMIALSDGMGKGRNASRESALTITSLYNLMKAGFDVELALRTINSLLLFKSTEEIFSTVDLGVFNKVTGKLKLFKIGAAATFVKRGDKVEAIKVSALPMGIVDSIRISNIELQVRRGDEIIIVSDGITDADRTDAQMDWIKEAIENIRSRDPQTMADLIINKAVERYGLKEKDDMTVITAVVN